MHNFSSIHRWKQFCRDDQGFRHAKPLSGQIYRDYLGLCGRNGKRNGHFILWGFRDLGFQGLRFIRWVVPVAGPFLGIR